MPASAPSVRLPLVVQLQGRGIPAAMFDRWTGFSTLGLDAGFAVAMPTAVNEVWNDGRYPRDHPDGPDDASYILDVVEDVASRISIDIRRIYLVGMSNGATMAARVACRHSDRVAAFAQVAGTAGVGIANDCRPARPVPIVNIHGTADELAPYEGGQRHTLRARLLLRSPAASSIGVDAWARLWVRANQAEDTPVTASPAADITVRRWQGATAASDVVFYRIAGGGHTWPGNRLANLGIIFGRTNRSLDATTEIWNFFSAHARTG